MKTKQKSRYHPDKVDEIATYIASYWSTDEFVTLVDLVLYDIMMDGNNEHKQFIKKIKKIIKAYKNCK